jgi:hypothetical protein
MCFSDRNSVFLTAAQDDPLHVFVPEVETFLRELLQLESRADQLDSICPFCKDGVAAIRCVDCFGGTVCCRDCTISIHARNPLHRVQVCANYFKEDPLLIAVTLRSGLALTSAMYH